MSPGSIPKPQGRPEPLSSQGVETQHPAGTTRVPRATAPLASLGPHAPSRPCGTGRGPEGAGNGDPVGETWAAVTETPALSGVSVAACTRVGSEGAGRRRWAAGSHESAEERTGVLTPVRWPRGPGGLAAGRPGGPPNGVPFTWPSANTPRYKVSTASSSLKS